MENTNKIPYNFYTYPIYLSNYIKIETKNNYKSLIAAKDIEPDTLLLIEHLISLPVNEAILLVANNEYLYNELHPRKDKWNDIPLLKNRMDNALEKVKMNGFHRSNEEIVLGDIISKANHSCDPNSIHKVVINTTILDVNVIYIALINFKKIKKGEEVTFYYGNYRGHEFEINDFHCNCGRSNKQLDEISLQLINIETQEYNKLEQIIKEKLKRTKNIEVLVAQKMFRMGFYIHNETSSNLTNELIQYLNNNYHGDGDLMKKKNQLIDDIYFKILSELK